MTTPLQVCCASTGVGGFNRETPQEVYDGCFTENEHVIESVNPAVSNALYLQVPLLVAHPRPEGCIDEGDWCGIIEAYKGTWTEENISKNRDIAYAMAKANTEKMIYKMAESESFEAISINPLHVIGPLMTENHNQFFSWQFFIWQLLQGNNFGSLDENKLGATGCYGIWSM